MMAAAVKRRNMRNDDDKSRQPQQQHGLASLTFCAVGITVCYLLYGILQEQLITDHDLGATFVLTAQCFCNVTVAALWQWLSSSTTSSNNNEPATVRGRGLPHGLMAVTAACYVTAMVCSNESVLYLSYPVMVLAKSCKIIPTMLVGQVVERRLYSQSEWWAACLISAGIVLFQLSRNDGKSLLSKNTTPGANADHSATGMILLTVSLTCDGILSAFQNIVKRVDDGHHHRHHRRPPTAAETMLWINVYAVLYLIPVSVLMGQWQGAVRLLRTTGPAPFSTMLHLNAAAAVGQIFIFLAIAWFTPVVTTLITTTRKFFTILLSVWIYGHPFSAAQWTSTLLVFCGLYAVLWTQRQQQSPPKIKTA
jgi:UDP-galactose transporter B1